MLTAAVTGSAGFLGKKLVSRLMECGWAVVPVVHDSTSDDFWDITTRPSTKMESRLRGVDVMFHTAAYLPKNYADYGEARRCAEINGLGTLNVLIAAQKVGIKRLIYVSGANLMQKNENGYIDDSSSYDCSYALSYFSSKALGEIYVNGFSDNGLSKLIVRPSSLYSLERPAQIMQYIRDCAKSSEPMKLYNEGRFSADYLFLNDLVEVLVAMGRSKLTGEMNVGSGSITSTYDFAKLACEVSGLDPNHYIQFVNAGERTKSVGFGAVRISRELLEIGFRPLEALDGFKQILS